MHAAPRRDVVFVARFDGRCLDQPPDLISVRLTLA